MVFRYRRKNRTRDTLAISVTVFHRYPQRAEALANGELLDVNEIAREDTFRLPTAITRRAWAATIAPISGDLRPELGPTNANRIHRLLRTAHNEIQKRWKEELTRLEFTVSQEREPTSSEATTVIIVATTKDARNPTLSIGLPEEFGMNSNDDVDAN